MQQRAFEIACSFPFMSETVCPVSKAPCIMEMVELLLTLMEVFQALSDSSHFLGESSVETERGRGRHLCNLVGPGLVCSESFESTTRWRGPENTCSEWALPYHSAASEVLQFHSHKIKCQKVPCLTLILLRKSL